MENDVLYTNFVRSYTYNLKAYLSLFSLHEYSLFRRNEI